MPASCHAIKTETLKFHGRLFVGESLTQQYDVNNGRRHHHIPPPPFANNWLHGCVNEHLSMSIISFILTEKLVAAKWLPHFLHPRGHPPRSSRLRKRPARFKEMGSGGWCGVSHLFWGWVDGEPVVLRENKPSWGTKGLSEWWMWPPLNGK